MRFLWYEMEIFQFKNYGDSWRSDMIVRLDVEWQLITIEISMICVQREKITIAKIQVSFIDRDYICISRAIYEWGAT